MANDAANAKQALDKKFSDYIENNSIEMYVDYRDELSHEQIQRILDGKVLEVRDEIEENYDNYVTLEDYYFDQMAEELKVDKEEIAEWLREEGFWPGAYLDDHGWNQLLRNSRAYITGTMWNAEFNFNNWAYGQPVTYLDVKESLKVLGINPAEFKALRTGGSATSGDGQFKGYFPNMPNRVPAINPKDLYDNMIVLYDGVLSFCLADVEQIAEVMASDSKYITFEKGTNLVMYEYSGGAGITDAPLTRDLTVKRSEVEFRNDSANRYGIQACYGFVHDYWSAGGIRNGK